MVSTVGDVARFFWALLQSRLLPPRLPWAMRTTVDAGTNLRYGLCLAAQSLPCGRAGWGHEGGLFGYQTWALSNRDGEDQVVMTVNTHAVWLAGGAATCSACGWAG